MTHNTYTWLSKSIPKCLPRSNENVCSIKDLCKNGPKSVNYNNVKVERTHLLTSRAELTHCVIFIWWKMTTVCWTRLMPGHEYWLFDFQKFFKMTENMLVAWNLLFCTVFTSGKLANTTIQSFLLYFVFCCFSGIFAFCFES